MIGRFTQEDEYRGDGLNLYAYCGNNPVGYYDLSGYAGKNPNVCKGDPQKTQQHNIGEGNAETYYRTMSEEDYNTLVKTKKLPATRETCISPTKGYSQKYDGVLVEFKVK